MAIWMTLFLFVLPNILLCYASRSFDSEQRDFDHSYRRLHNRVPTAAETFRFFDDYLLAIRENEGRGGFRLPEPNEYFERELPARGLSRESSRLPPEEQHDQMDRQKISETLLLARIRNDRTSPKFACCALGQVAGNHGFHCNVKFYENRIQTRNRNRAQTRQAALEDIEREPDYNENLWNTFGNCVRKHAKSFHHCCYAARILGTDSVDYIITN